MKKELRMYSKSFKDESIRTRTQEFQDLNIQKSK